MDVRHNFVVSCARLPALVVVILSVCLSCSSPPPTAPTTPATPATPDTPTPAPPVVTDLALSALPGFLNVGQSVQLSATATLSDGSQKPADAAWQSSNESVATVSREGLVAVVGFGEADIIATASGLSAKTHAFAPGRPSIRLTTTIGAYGSTVAIYGVNPVTFDLGESAGTGLTYHVSYGDGGSSGGPLASHIYSAPGTYVVQGTVSDILGRTDTVSRSIRVVSMAVAQSTYGWIGGGGHLWFDSQVGAAVSGRYWDGFYAGITKSFTGTLGAEGGIDLTLADASARMVGHVTLVNACGTFCPMIGDYVVLTFMGGLYDGRNFSFQPVDPF